MATLTVQETGLSGLKPVFVAATSGGDDFVNDGSVVLHVKNGGGGSITVTANSQRNCDQGFDHDLAVSVPAGEERMIGPFSTRRFNVETGADKDKVKITYSGITSVTVAAIKVSE